MVSVNLYRKEMTDVERTHSQEHPLTSPRVPNSAMVVSDGSDTVLGVIGAVGRWQACQSVLLSLVGVVCGWQVLVIAFLAPPTDHWCAPPSEHWDPRQWRTDGIPAADGVRILHPLTRRDEADLT